MLPTQGFTATDTIAVFNFVLSRYADVPREVDHVCRVAKQAKNSGERNVALCHDLVEDGYATIDELHFLLTAEEVAAVVLLTREDYLPYADYIDQIERAYRAHQPGADIAVAVKCYDLFDHLSPDIVHNLTEEKIDKYLSALSDLTYVIVECHHERGT